MKRYVIQVVIEEGCDEFWEDLARRNASGCEQVVDCIRAMLTVDGDPFQPQVKLISFQDS